MSFPLATVLGNWLVADFGCCFEEQLLELSACSLVLFNIVSLSISEEIEEFAARRLPKG
jgi:hypothetical protein